MLRPLAGLRRHFLPIIIGFFILFSWHGVYAQQQGHTYPRIGAFYWGGGVAEYFAKFDLVVLTIYVSDQMVYDIKSLNPDAIVMPTIDWNAAAQRSDDLPNEFKLTLADGQQWGWYGVGTNPIPNKVAPNFSDVCPVVNGKQCWQLFAEIIANLEDLSIWDGCATDGFYAGLHMEYHIPPGVDLDLNGVPDIDEHGKTWIVSHWNNGCKLFLERLRELIGPDEPILINTGQWFNGHATIEPVNGAICEYWGYTNNWRDWERVKYLEFMSKARYPRVSLVQSNPTSNDPHQPADPKDYWRMVRFGLTRSMLGDAYFGYEDLYDAYHYYCFYYDEFELDVGYPTTDMLEWAGKDVWVRFFDEGVSICNLSYSAQTITDADLRTLPGYAGPYYRFKGGQVPDFNNGQPFTSVLLEGDQFTGWDQNNYIIGDGIILVKGSQTHITDIVVDNVNVGTTPGSRPPAFSGTWTDIYLENNAYRLRVAEWITERKLSGYAITSGGSSAAAVFTPTIGVAGVYGVYEWHGYHDGSESSAVKYTINHANGSRDVLINQRENQGGWNYLGEYYFNAGKTGNVTVSAQSSSGTVMADAVKFVYLPDGEADVEPPLTPNNVRTSVVTENRIGLVWDAPAAASDGDQAMFYRVYRNGDWVGTIVTTAYLDTGLTENTPYSYAIYSEDDAGNQCVTPLQYSISTITDQTPPRLVAVEAQDFTHIKVVFSEPITQVSAETRNNFQIESGVTVLSASLQEDLQSVVLSTSEHVVGVGYTLVVNGIRDRSAAANLVEANSSLAYEGRGGPIRVTISCDDSYQLYVNGNLVGSSSGWNTAQTYEASSIAGKNVVAVKGTDVEGLAGMVAEVDFNGEHYVTNDSWKVSPTFVSGWETVAFDDLQWPKATSLGAHGTATPWADYANVQNISTTDDVQWIWTSDNENDDIVYFRFTLRASGDVTPPNIPTGLRRK